MNKKYFAIMFTILIIVFAFTYTFSIAEETPVSVKLNESTLNLENSAINKNGDILIPMDDFLSEFNAETIWHDETEQITCAHNNMFAKLFIGKKEVYLNGILVEYQHPVEIIDDTAYAPVSFYADFLSLSYVESKDSIEFKQRDNLNSIFHGNTLFIETPIKEHGLTISLPFGWVPVSDNSYGVTNPYESYSFTINKHERQYGESPIDYRAELKSSLPNPKNPKPGDTIIENITESELVTNDCTFYSLYYNTATLPEKEISEKNDPISRLEEADTDSDGKPDSDKDLNDKKEIRDLIKKDIKHHAYYICVAEDDIYEFHFTHTKTKLKHSVLQDFEYALSTVKFPPNHFNSTYENYIEYPKFQELRINLKNDLTSNHEVYDGLTFEGYSENFYGGDFIAKVKRDGESREFIIPIDEASNFSSKIYTPFGVGKHQIEIYFKEPETLYNIPLMSFSVVNLSGRDIKYIVPGEKVRSKSEDMEKLLTEVFEGAGLDKTYSSEHDIAKCVFSALEKKLIITEPYRDGEEPRNSQILVDEIYMSETEANILFTSLMRSAGISTKIEKGSNYETERIFCQCFINGEWKVYDLPGAIKNDELIASNQITEEEKRFSMVPEKRLKNFSKLSPLVYENFFYKIEDLNY